MNLDLTGSSPDNRLTSSIPIEYNGSKLAILSPQGGFFHTSMSSPIIRHNGGILKYGKDYRYVYRSKEIRDKYKISAHASIMLLRPELTGYIEMEASYVGAKYQLYRSDYVAHITSTEYLLSLYDVNSLTDLPDELPPKASILDVEKVNRGMLSSVQLVFSVGLYLKDFEADKDKPSTGRTWPDVTIGDLAPPVKIFISMEMGRGHAIPKHNLARRRLNFIPLGYLPLGADKFD